MPSQQAHITWQRVIADESLKTSDAAQTEEVLSDPMVAIASQLAASRLAASHLAASQLAASQLAASHLAAPSPLAPVTPLSPLVPMAPLAPPLAPLSPIASLPPLYTLPPDLDDALLPVSMLDSMVIQSLKAFLLLSTFAPCRCS